MAAIVGLLHLKLQFPEARSLKDKRRALKSFKDRMRNTHNVSVAEVDGTDHRQWSVLAVAMTGDDRRYIEGGLQDIRQAASLHRDTILVDAEIEWL